jgi:hypothetical protein
LWHACNEILPTKEKLFSRSIVTDPLCQLCGQEAETSSHVIWQCPASTDVWAECNRRNQKTVIVDVSFLAIFEHLQSRLETEEMELVSLVAQKLWFRRNRVIFGGIAMSPTCLVKCAQETLHNFHQALATPATSARAPEKQRIHWTKPPFGQLKLNAHSSLNSFTGPNSVNSSKPISASSKSSNNGTPAPQSTPVNKSNQGKKSATVAAQVGNFEVQ